MDPIKNYKRKLYFKKLAVNDKVRPCPVNRWVTKSEFRRAFEELPDYPIDYIDYNRKYRQENRIPEPKHITDARLWSLGKHPVQLSGQKRLPVVKKEREKKQVNNLTSKQLKLF